MPKTFKPIITASIILAFGQFALVLYFTLQMKTGGASGIPLAISLAMILPIIGVGFILALLVSLINSFGRAKSPWKEELPYLIYASGTHLLLLYEAHTDKHKSLAARLMLKYPHPHILESSLSESVPTPEVVELAFIGREGEAVCFEEHEQIKGVWERCEIGGENSSKISNRLGEKNESKKSSEMISQSELFPPLGRAIPLASLWRLYQVYLHISRPIHSQAISESSLDSENSPLDLESSLALDTPTYTLLNHAPSSMLWRFEKLLPPLDKKMTHTLKQLQRKDRARFWRRVGGLLSLPFVAIMLYEAWRFMPFVNNTALANYASVENTTMVGFLLNHGADPHIKRSANFIDYSLAWLFTPKSQWSEKREWLERSGFEYAIYHHNNEMFELLLRPEAVTYKHIEVAIREGNFYAMTRLLDYILNPSEFLLQNGGGCEIALKKAVSLYAPAYEGKIYDRIFALNAISQHRLFLSDREAIVMFLLERTDMKAYATQCAEGGLYVILQSSGVGEDMLKAFLHAGLIPQKRDIEYGRVSPSLLELFAKNGYRFNARDLFLLLWGDQVWEDKLRALEIALQNGANPNEPYMTRALSGYYEDTNAQADSEIATYPLHRAFSVAILELLYQYGMRNINQPYITPDGTAHTQLQRILANKKPDLKALLWLLNHGARYDKSDLAKLYALLESHEKSLENEKEDLAEEVWERQSMAFKELKGEILKIIAK